MSENDNVELDPEFARRMRSGLARMAVRERERQRKQRRGIATGLGVAAVIALVAIVGPQFVGQPNDSDQATEPTTVPTSLTPVETTPPDPPAPVETSAPPVEPTPPPTPTPPPGFEGVAAGEVIVVGEFGTGGRGDAVGDEVFPSYVDVYVLCQGAGEVLAHGYAVASCADRAAGSILIVRNVGDDPGVTDVSASPDFNGTFTFAPVGQAPTAASVGGTATVYMTCYGPSRTYTFADTVVDCNAVVGDSGLAREVAVWGVPYSAGQFGPVTPSGSTKDDDIVIVLEGPF